jgi:hypothetical protein
MGPALLPESLERLKRKDAVATIRDGRAATQMPAFGQILTGAEIEALAEWIHTPVSPAPTWSEADIRNSRIEHFPPGSLPDTRQGVVAKADPMNLFIVVEAGDHHVSVLDGDRMERIHRFPSRYALHGGPKFSPDGRYVYFASRDGWISKFDIWNLQVVAEVRAGINTRNAAVSATAATWRWPTTCPAPWSIFDADLKLLRVIDGRQPQGRRAIAHLGGVRRRPAARASWPRLKDMPELWEISYDPAAQDIATGFVHDYKYRRGGLHPGLSEPPPQPAGHVLDDFFFTQELQRSAGHLPGGARPGGEPGRPAQDRRARPAPACPTWARASRGSTRGAGWLPAPT